MGEIYACSPSDQTIYNTITRLRLRDIDTLWWKCKTSQ